MRSFILTTLATLALGVAAAPEMRIEQALAARSDDAAAPIAAELNARDDDDDDGFYDEDLLFCLTKARAQAVATNFGNLIANYTVTLANKALTSDFVDYSDSVSTLIDGGCSNGPATLGAATFTSRANFEAGQGSQPPIPFKQLDIWHSCHAVIIRWVSLQTPEQVTGIIVLETEYDAFNYGYPDLIKTVFSEFNSGAWLVNLGVFKPNCTA